MRQDSDSRARSTDQNEERLITANSSLAQTSTVSLFNWVWRSYFRTALIPLLRVEVAFILIYLITNYLATRENLTVVRGLAAVESRRIAQWETGAIQKQLKAIARTTDLFCCQTASLLQKPFEPRTDELRLYGSSPEGVYHTTELMGGEIRMKSGQGAGSMFWFHVPPDRVEP